MILKRMATVAFVTVALFAPLVQAQAETEKEIEAIAIRYEAIQSFFPESPARMTKRMLAEIKGRLICLRKDPNSAACSLDDHTHDIETISGGLRITKQFEDMYELALQKQKGPAFAESAMQQLLLSMRYEAKMNQDRVDKQGAVSK